MINCAHPTHIRAGLGPPGPWVDRIVGMLGLMVLAGLVIICFGRQFWDNIAAGRDSVTEVPAGRWALNGAYQPGPPSPGRTRKRPTSSSPAGG